MSWNARTPAGITRTEFALYFETPRGAAAVWKSVDRALQERGTTRFLAIDPGGHGGSDWQSCYSVGQLAAQVAELLQQQIRESYIAFS